LSAKLAEQGLESRALLGASRLATIGLPSRLRSRAA
jgi:hypothetical protein